VQSAEKAEHLLLLIYAVFGQCYKIEKL